MRRIGAWSAFLGSAALLALFVALLAMPSDRAAAGSGPLLVYCGAGIKLPVEDAARAYEKECGVRVTIQPGPSQVLLTQAEQTRRGDLFLPGDDRYLRMAREKALIDEIVPLARVRPALAVRQGNPRGVRKLEDLLTGDLRVACPNPESAAAGHLVREALQAAGTWEAVSKRLAVTKPTVNDVANDLQVGVVDAAFVWNATVRQIPGLELVDLPALAGKEAFLSVGVLRSAAQPSAALRFARFLSARDRGLKDFERRGFDPVAGDAWADSPEIVLYAGAMLRAAIEPTIKAFRRREGVEIKTVYNGCGILVGQMKMGHRPDAYFACDESFMKEVRDLFEAPREISVNQLAILVHKGNPHGVKTLRDLGKPGLKIGVGHEKQCALGQLTKDTLVEERVYGDVMKNVVEQAPTGDLLVNQLRTGALDAVVAYVSNATGSADKLEPIAINVPCALAVQPAAVGKESPRRQLASRLIDAFASPASKAEFLRQGFRWKAGP